MCDGRPRHTPRLFFVGYLAVIWDGNRRPIWSYNDRAVKVKRRTHKFKKAGIESLCIAIELFNRPSQVGRDQSVILMLAHSFEMLLKAIIFQRRGTIRDRGDQYTYGFGRCINLAHSEMRLLETVDLPMLWAIKQDRNAAAHDTVAFSEDMLWLHVRSGVTIFGKLLSAAFNEDLPTVIPSRVIPVSALPPTDARAAIEREMQDISSMLKPGLRQGEDARARVRPLLALDGAVTGREEAPTEVELDRAIAAFRRGKNWEGVFPGLTTLEIAPKPGGGVQEVSLRISKAREGPAVRLAKPGEETGALLYRKSDPFDEYGIKLSEFGKKLGASQSDGYALTWYLNLKGDPGAYYCRKTKAGNIQFQGLSARALELARKEIAKPSFKWSKVRAAYKNRTL